MLRVEVARTGEAQDGFVLVEALMALGILAATLLLVNATFAAGWRTHLRAEREDAARSIARALLAETGVTSPPQAGVSTGVDGGIEWRVEVVRYQPGPVPGPVPGLVPVTPPRISAWWVHVVVSWKDDNGGDGRDLKLTTVKLSRGRQ